MFEGPLRDLVSCRPLRDRRFGSGYKRAIPEDENCDVIFIMALCNAIPDQLMSTGGILEIDHERFRRAGVCCDMNMS